MAADPDRSVLVAHQHGVAEILETVAGIDHHAVLGSLHRRALGHRDVDAVIRLAVAAAVAGDDAAADRPAHLADAGTARRCGGVIILGLGDDLVGLFRRRIGGDLLAIRLLGWPSRASDDRIDARFCRARDLLATSRNL